MQANESIVIYDRGIPDNIAYSEIFNLDHKPAHLASKLFRYDKNSFIFPAWEAIYATDNELKMSFLQAKAFGDNVRKIYENYGYSIIDVPCSSPEERAQFIIERLK